MTMKFLTPNLLTDAQFVSSTRAENDHTAWNAATAYTAGNRVIRTSTHRIYERLISGTTATAPESDTTNWASVGPTNRWAMFDQAVGSVTSQATPLTVVIDPGFISALALLDVAANTVTVSMLDAPAGASVYSKTVDMTDTAILLDWWMYFFDPITPRTALLLDDLPPYASGRLTVSLAATTTAYCGTMAVGDLVVCGSVRNGAKTSIIDYSKKETDIYGITTIVQRPYAKRIEVALVLENTRVDYLTQKLAAIRATPVVWYGDATFESLSAYGWVRDWGITIAYPDFSEASLTIEGLV